MTMRIFSVGYDIPSPDVESVQFKSNDSILDAHIVIFSPTLKDYGSDGAYAGQPLLSEWGSDQPRQHTALLTQTGNKVVGGFIRSNA